MNNLIVFAVIALVFSIVGVQIFRFVRLKYKAKSTDQYVCLFTGPSNNARCIAEIGAESINITDFVPSFIERFEVKYTAIRSVEQDYSWYGKKVVIQHADGKFGLATDKADEIEAKIRYHMDRRV